MEIIREGFRWMIFYDFKKGLTRQECLVWLRETFGNEASSKKTVYNWFAECGRVSVNDESREGRPKSIVIPTNIDAVRKMIEEDRHVTYREIEASLDISQTAIHSILHEHLAVKKICSRSIPHNLIEAQKEPRTNWCTLLNICSILSSHLTVFIENGYTTVILHYSDHIIGHFMVRI